MSDRAGLSDAEYDALVARIDAAFKHWTLCLGLRWWQVNVDYIVDPSQFSIHGDTPSFVTAMDVDADWTRTQAHVRVNMLAVAEIDDEKLSEIVCHELCHVLVSEMRVPEWANAPNEVLHRQLDAEERVVTLLTKAFGWVYDAGAGELRDPNEPEANQAEDTSADVATRG